MLSNSIALIAVAALFGVEAYKASDRLPRIVLTVLAVIFSAGGLLLQQITDASPNIGTFITSIVSQPVSWFILFMALFFVLRPFWQSKPAPPQPPATIDQLAANGVLADVHLLRQRLEKLEDLPVRAHEHDGAALRTEVADVMAFAEATAEALSKETDKKIEDAISGRIGEGLHRDTVAATFEASDGRFGSMVEHFEGRCDDLSKAVEALAAAMAATDNALFEKVGDEKKRINAIIDDNNRTAVQIENLQGLVNELKKATAKIPEALHAIYQREILTRAAADIEAIAGEMYDALHSGETYDETRWLAWEEAHGRWESLVRLWVENGRWYAPTVDARVYLVDDEKYGLDWTVKDAQFPDTERLSRSEAVRRFKKFRIIHTQWRDVRDEVDRGIIQVAFVGLTPEDVRRRPGDDPRP